MSAVASRSVEPGRRGVASTAALARPHDPVALVLGEEEPRSFVYAAALVALLLHIGMLGSAAAAELLRDLRLAVIDNRAKIHDFFWRQYDVELPKEEKPKVEEKAPDPPPEPEPAPPPAPKAPAPKDDDPYKNLPPPAPAKAAPVLTQKEDPDEPQDLTGNTVVSGDGTATYGQVSAAGTGSAPVMAPNATLKGVQGGKGTGPAVPPPPAEDKSRPPGIDGGLSWRGCPFPPEADAEDINTGVVTLVVTVRADGSPISATVTGDPGHGFGRAARVCAMARRYRPGLDRSGQPMTMTTPPIRVTFSR